MLETPLKTSRLAAHGSLFLSAHPSHDDSLWTCTPYVAPSNFCSTGKTSLACEQLITVRHYVVGETVILVHIVKKQLGCAFCYILIRRMVLRVT